MSVSVVSLASSLRAALAGFDAAPVPPDEWAGLVGSLAAVFPRALAAMDPAAVPGAECAALVAELAAAEKACAAARVRLAARAVSCGAHRGAGFRDGADWLAAVSGSSAGEARSALATAARLEVCPATRAAVVAGELSLAQASEITAAEADAPGGEVALVGLAKRSTLAALRDEARRRRFAAVEVEVVHARQRAARSVRHWRDDLGMVCGRFVLAPEVGVGFVHRLDAETDRIRRAARRAGSTEERDAHAADAFAALLAAGTHPAVAAGSAPAPIADDAERPGAGAGAGPAPGVDAGVGAGSPAGEAAGGTGTGVVAGTGAGPPSGAAPGGTAGGTVRRDGRSRARSADLVIVCDLGAWRRGHAHGGEPCHLVGGTPIPVRVARELADDAFVKAVLHDGRRIDTVVHWGRHIPAEVRTALELGAPPDFAGAVCCEPGCGRRHGLEWDHVNPVANRGPTSYANLAARCWPHHHDKTDRDRAAGRLGRTRAGPGPP